MRKKIYRGMLWVTLMNLLLASIFLSFTFYRTIETQVKSELAHKAQILAEAARQVASDGHFISLLNTDNSGTRITLIAPDGIVQYDNRVYAEQIENHFTRPEIQQAAMTGFGEDTRFSSTLKMRTYYYALRMEDGRYLRVAKSISGVFEIFAATLPLIITWVLILLAINLWLSARLTKNIVAPINEIDLDKPDLHAYDELTAFIRTILHQRALIEDQLRGLEKRAGTIQSIIDHMQEGFLMLNGAGLVAAANRSALRVFGAEGDCTGRDILEITRDMAFLEKVKQALAGRSSEILLEQERVYRVFLNPVEDNGIIILFVDVTDSQRAEQMRRGFTANVSHELKTPLTSISGYAEMMLTGLVNPEDTRYFAGKMKEEASRMIALVDDILFLSRLDETEHRRVYDTFDLYALAAEALETKQVAAEARQVTLSLTGGPCEVEASRLLLYEMLVNLIDNGIKYNVPQGRVEVSIAQEEGKTCLRVSDTGIGIPEEHLPRVFERFYRVDPSRSKKTGGTGLGLSIVKHIAQYHEGTVDIKSKLSEGTEVNVRWP